METNMHGKFNLPSLGTHYNVIGYSMIIKAAWNMTKSNNDIYLN